MNVFRDNHVRLAINPKQNRKSKKTLKELKEILDEFKKRSLKIIIIRDTPLLRGNNIEICNFQKKIFKNKTTCEVDEIQDLHTRKRQDFIFNSLEEYSNLNGIDLYSWDPLPLFKKKNGKILFIDENSLYIMLDKHHISPSFSKSLIPNFKLFLFEKNI